MGLLHIQFKQIINVTKALGAKGDTIFQQCKFSAGTSTRVDRRAYRREMLLSRATIHPHTRNAIQHLTGVRGGDVSDGLCIDHADATAVTQTLLQTGNTQHQDLFQGFTIICRWLQVIRQR